VRKAQSAKRKARFLVRGRAPCESSRCTARPGTPTFTSS
jgi:hypothetical protein